MDWLLCCRDVLVPYVWELIPRVDRSAIFSRTVFTTSTMDLLREAYGSDSSASSGHHDDDTKMSASKPPARPAGAPPAQQRNEQPGVSSTSAAEPVPDGKPAGSSNNKSSAKSSSMEKSGNGRTCMACHVLKNRDCFSKNQWNKPVNRCRCKSCVEQNCEIRPQRESSAPTGWIKKSVRKASEPPAKKQKISPQWDPEDVEVVAMSGSHRYTVVINRNKTVRELKVMMSEEMPGLPLNYFHFTFVFKRLLSKRPIKDYLKFASKNGDKTILKLMLDFRRPPRRVDLARYFVSSEDLVDVFQHQKPFRCIRHSSDIRDLAGKYDVICKLERSGNIYERSLERLSDAKMDIRHRGTDHIEGTIFGCMGLDERDYATFHTENALGLDDNDVSQVEFSIDKLSSANLMQNHFISIEKHEGDNAASFDYDSDEVNPNLLKGSVLVLEKQAFVPRTGIDIENFTAEKGERLLKEYNIGFGSSFIRRHFPLPEAASKVIYLYWREEPPPCLVLESGDAFITMREDDATMQDGGWDHCVICRRNQDQRPINRFEEWKRKERKKLLWHHHPMIVATYPFEEAFQKEERRKQKGRKQSG